LPERVLGYARVSVSSEDLENQRRAIEEYAREKGYDLLAVVEDTVTGASNPLERPAFRKLLELARMLGVRRVIVYALDRLTRGGVGEAYETLRLLRENGLTVEFVRERGVDLSDPILFDTFVFAFGLAARLEREAMHRRLEAARRAGKRIGRPPYEIPWERVRQYLEKGLSVKDVYRLLVADGYLRRRTKDGRTVVMSYRRFLERVKMNPETARLLASRKKLEAETAR